MLVVLLILVVYLSIEEQRKRGVILLMTAIVFGFAIDNAMLSESVLIPEGSGQFAPLWMTALWPLLATTLNVAFKGLQTKLVLASVLAGIAAPFSYFAAVRLDAAAFGVPAEFALLGIGCVWMIAFPVALLYTRQLMR